LPTYSTAGKFTNSRIEAFSFTPFFPYKTNNFYCFDFTHTKKYHNIYSVTANLVLASPSILDNVEQSLELNENVGVKFGPHSTSISARDTEQTFGFPKILHNSIDMRIGQRLYHFNDYRSMKLTRDVNASVDSNINIFGIAQHGFSSTPNVISQHSDKRHSMFINDVNDCDYYPYKPIYGNGDNLEYRMFDFRPTDSISIQKSPKYKSLNSTDLYNKFNKYGFNANLNNVSLTFAGRSDLEAKKILFFLESHLGYKRFGFHMLDNYMNLISDNNNQYSPNRQKVSTFVCPNWSHRMDYLNNHTITATFLETVDH
jgi:phage-related protein